MSLTAEKAVYAISVATAGFHSGALAGWSMYSIPALLFPRGMPENVLLTQWRNLYDLGVKYSPPLAMAGMLLNFGNAYNHYSRVDPFKAYKFIAAGLTIFSIYPFTFAVIMPTNNQLFAKEERLRGGVKGEDSASMQETHQLVKKWGRLNWLRSIIVGAGLGIMLTEILY